MAKVYRKADKKKKGPRNLNFVGLSSGMAHEMAVSSAFLYYGRRNLNFVPRVFLISSVNPFFLVVATLYAGEVASRDFQGKGKAVVESSGSSGQRGGFWKKQRTRPQTLAMVATTPVRVAPAAPVRATPIRQAPHLRCFSCGEPGHMTNACPRR